MMLEICRYSVSTFRNLGGFPNGEGSVYLTQIKKIDGPEERKSWTIDRRQLKHLFSIYVNIHISVVLLYFYRINNIDTNT